MSNRKISKSQLLALVNESNIPEEAEITNIKIHTNGLIEVETIIDEGYGQTFKKYNITNISHDFSRNKVGNENSFIKKREVQRRTRRL
jgi:hypothetical protein